MDCGRLLNVAAVSKHILSIGFGGYATLMRKYSVAFACFLLLSSLHDGYCQERIRVGQGSVSMYSGLMYIGKDRGLFAKYGLMTEVIYIWWHHQRPGFGLRKSRSLAA